MSGSDPGPVLSDYRGYLLVLARAQWDSALQAWGDPSDLVHQTLLEAHQKQSEFKGGTAAAFAAWLRTMLAHNLADAVRGRRRRKRDHRLERSIEAALEESSARLGAALAQADPSPSERARTAEQLARLADALERLPADQREAVTLHHLRGLTLEVAAAQMGKTKAAVAGLLRRGLGRLAQTVGDRE